MLPGPGHLKHKQIYRPSGACLWRRGASASDVGDGRYAAACFLVSCVVILGLERCLQCSVLGKVALPSPSPANGLLQLLRWVKTGVVALAGMSDPADCSNMQISQRCWLSGAGFGDMRHRCFYTYPDLLAGPAGVRYVCMTVVLVCGWGIADLLKLLQGMMCKRWRHADALNCVWAVC